MARRAVPRGEHRYAFERFVKICAALRVDGSIATNITLAREMEVSRKTIQRDLHFLRDRLSLPLVYSSHHQRWFLDPSVKLPWHFRSQ